MKKQSSKFLCYCPSKLAKIRAGTWQHCCASSRKVPDVQISVKNLANYVKNARDFEMFANLKIVIKVKMLQSLVWCGTIFEMAVKFHLPLILLICKNLSANTLELGTLAGLNLSMLDYILYVPFWFCKQKLF